MPHFLPIAPRCIFVSNQTATKSAPLVHPHSLAISRHFWRNHWWWSFWHIRHYQSNRRCDHNKSTECIQSHCLRLSGNDRLCKCRIFFLPHFVCRRKCQSLGRIGERYQCFLRVCIHNYKRRSTLLIFCNVHFAKVSQRHLLYKTVKKWILITYHSQCSQSSNSWQRTCHTFHQSLLAYIRICHPEHIGVVSSLNQIKTQVNLKWKCKIVSKQVIDKFIQNLLGQPVWHTCRITVAWLTRYPALIILVWREKMIGFASFTVLSISVSIAFQTFTTSSS